MALIRRATHAGSWYAGSGKQYLNDILCLFNFNNAYNSMEGICEDSLRSRVYSYYYVQV